MIKYLFSFIIIILPEIIFTQECDDNMLMFDCDDVAFCNNEPDFGFDCYVNNEFCEDFNGDGIIDAWLGDGWCDDGTWGVDFQCEEYSFDCGDCGDEFSDTYGYCEGIPESFSFNHEGLIRQYYLYVPELLEDNAPLVFVMHGYGGSANGIISYSGMNTIADQYGFAVCYPNGTIDQSGNRFWNVGYNMHQNETVDDVDFLSSLAQFLQEEYNLSNQNTFSTGMSNGGDISYMLACQAPNIFSAIAPVAGCMMTWIFESCDPSFPVPVFEIHGTNDNVTWWEGDPNDLGGWGPYIGTEEGIDFWVDVNNCSEYLNESLPNIDPGDGSYIISHSNIGCDNNNVVLLYEIVNGGHDWPGAFGNMDINSSVEIWNFFSQFTFVLGDLNNDNEINILDIVALVNIILGLSPIDTSGDINQDGIINVLDVIQLINIILND